MFLSNTFTDKERVVIGYADWSFFDRSFKQYIENVIEIVCS